MVSFLLTRERKQGPRLIRAFSGAERIYTKMVEDVTRLEEELGIVREHSQNRFCTYLAIVLVMLNFLHHA